MPRTPATLTENYHSRDAEKPELRDHIVPGLSIWRAERGRGWSLTYASPLTGKRRRLKLGSPDTGMDLEAARAAARAQLSLLAQASIRAIRQRRRPSPG